MPVASERRAQIEIEYLYQDTAAKFGRWKNILVVAGHASPTVDNAATYQRLMAQLLRENKTGIGVLTLIGGNTTPQPEARDALVSAFSALGDRVAASFVVESGGFAVAAQRAIITTILLASGLRKRINVSPTLGTGIAWLLERLGLDATNATSRAFCAAVQRFCEAESLEVTA